MLLDHEKLKEATKMSPPVAEFIRDNPVPPIDWSNHEVVRKSISTIERLSLARLGGPEPSIIEEYRDIPMRDGYLSQAKITRPSDPSADNGPLLVYIFPGGFIAGSNESGTAIARSFVRAFGATVASISYRLAPAHKWPTSWDDAWDNILWLSQHASEVHADLSKGFIVGGIAAGATLSAFVTTESQRHHFAHPITGQWLCMPSVMDKKTVPLKYSEYYRSYDENIHDPILPASATAYLSDVVEWDDTSPKRWPVLHDMSSAELVLPPTYIQASGMDPMRDDALIYHEVLKDAGVDAELDFFPGCPHAHFLVMPDVEPSRKAVAGILMSVGKFLGTPITAAEAETAIRS